MSLPFSQNATIAAKRAGIKIAVLTAYDYPTAKLLEEAGIDWLLVGDSLGMVVLGFPDTTSVTLADMAHHTAAVARGATKTPIVADLPIHSYDTPEDSLRSAKTLIAAGAHAVKLEGGSLFADRIETLTRAGIPTMGHLGMLPQSVREEGGYKIKGRTQEEADRLVADALALEKAGAFAIVLELVDPPTAGRISSSIQIPTIGIGSGTGCDGQVLVTHDVVGAFPWFRPKFAKPKAAIGETIREAAQAFAKEVRG